jgi:hypothetical protein
MAAKKRPSARKRTATTARATPSTAPRETVEIARGPHDETDHMIAAAHAGVGDEPSPAVAPPAHVPRQGDTAPAADAAAPSEG